MSEPGTPPITRKDMGLAPALEFAAKYLTVSVGLLYGIGLLVANYYLMSLGFSEFELFRSRYVFIGATAVLPLIGATTFVYLLTSMPDPASYIGRHRASLSLMFGTLIAMLGVAIVYGFRRQVLWTLLFTVILSAAFLIFETPERLPVTQNPFIRFRTKDADSTTSPIFLLFLITPLIFYFIFWSKSAFPRIPEQFGGSEPNYGHFFVRESHVADAQLVGLTVDPENRRTQGVRMIWHGNDYLIFQLSQSDAGTLTKVSNELFYAWSPADEAEPAGTPTAAS